MLTRAIRDRSAAARGSPQWVLALLMGSALGASGASCSENADRSGSNARGSVETWSIEEPPLVTIGSAHSPADALFGVIAATRLSDGSIAVVNRGLSEIRYYSASGSYLGKAGGPGRGPSEFTLILAAARLRGDSIGVMSSDRAISIVAGPGAVVRKTSIDMAAISFSCRAATSWDLTVDATVIVGAEPLREAGCAAAPIGLYRDTTLFARFDPLTSGVDTLVLVAGADREDEYYAAFGRIASVAVGSDRIHVGETGAGTVLVLAHDGELLGRWNVPMEPERVPPLADRRRSDRNGGGPLQPPPTPQIPGVYPRYARLIADRAGNLWVMKYPRFSVPETSIRLSMIPIGLPPLVGPTGAEWIVLDARGERIARVRTPPDLYVLEIGADYILGLTLDALDVERVRMHHLTR